MVGPVPVGVNSFEFEVRPLPLSRPAKVTDEHCGKDIR